MSKVFNSGKRWTWYDCQKLLCTILINFIPIIFSARIIYHLALPIKLEHPQMSHNNLSSNFQDCALKENICGQKWIHFPKMSHFHIISGSKRDEKAQSDTLACISCVILVAFLNGNYVKIGYFSTLSRIFDGPKLFLVNYWTCKRTLIRFSTRAKSR